MTTQTTQKFTCQYCRNSPATHLVAADMRIAGSFRRIKDMVCGGCADRTKSDAEHDDNLLCQVFRLEQA